MHLFCILLLLAMSTPALAQPAQPPDPPLVQALRFKLNLEMENGVQCNAVVVSNQQSMQTMQRALAQAHARVAELEAQLKALAPKVEDDAK